MCRHKKRVRQSPSSSYLQQQENMVVPGIEVMRIRFFVLFLSLFFFSFFFWHSVTGLAFQEFLRNAWNTNPRRKVVFMWIRTIKFLRGHLNCPTRSNFLEIRRPVTLEKVYLVFKWFRTSNRNLCRVEQCQWANTTQNHTVFPHFVLKINKQ
jgi:hypothetical protein